jgi:hypothetical protein
VPHLTDALSTWVRGIAGRLLEGFPRLAYDGMELIVVDESRAHLAKDYFDHTVSALQVAARAENGYAELKGEVKRILFWSCDTGLPYHPFQQAIIVPPEVALEADAVCFAAWLLYASESIEPAMPGKRLTELFETLPTSERTRVTGWLAETMSRARLARESVRVKDDLSNRSCSL